MTLIIFPPKPIRPRNDPCEPAPIVLETRGVAAGRAFGDQDRGSSSAPSARTSWRACLPSLAAIERQAIAKSDVVCGAGLERCDMEMPEGRSRGELPWPA